MKNLDIIGEYAVLLDGKEVHRQKNSMTVAGKNAAMRTLIGYQSRFANKMAIGIGNTANTLDANSRFITNQTLDGEIDRLDISSAFVDTSELYSKLIFKASSSKAERCSIYELGLYSPPLNSTNNSQVILSFEPTESITGAGVTSITDTSLYSYGDGAIVIGPNRTATYSAGVKKITSLSNSDEISIVYRKASSFSSTVTLVFYSGDSNYISFSFTSTASGIISQKKQISENSGVTGTIDWNNITKINIQNGAGGDVTMDLLRFNQSIETNSVDSALLSRVVLSSPIEKSKNQQLDIEYYLSLGFNEGI